MTADLEIRVTTNNDTNLTYVLRYAEGQGEKFDCKIKGPEIHMRPRDYQLEILKRLELLGQQLGFNDQKLSAAEAEQELATLGHELYKELFPPELRSEYCRFRNRIKSLLIVTDEPWIPWEIVKPYSTEGDDHFDDDFICCRFEMTRWLAKGGTLLPRITATRITAIEAAAPESSRRLRYAREEIQFLRKIAERNDVDIDTLYDATYPKVYQLLEDGGNHVLLFVGHGKYDENDPNESRFLLMDGRSLRPRDLHGLIERKLQQDRTLVFFNSCQVAQQDFSLTRIGGWATRWVCECGCGVFVGPQWSVDDALACLFSQTFFAALDRGETFGQAARTARLQVRQQAPGHPSFLAYTIYAHPNGRLYWGSGPQEDSRSLRPPLEPTVSITETSTATRWGQRMERRGPNPRIVVGLLAILAVLAAVGFHWRSGDRDGIVSLSPILPPPPTSPPPGPSPPAASPAEDLIDISALQKPPYKQSAVSFYLLLPQTADPPRWRQWIESSAKKQLTTVGLDSTRSTSAAWLVVLEFSDHVISQGATGRICQIQASFELYHERQTKGVTVSIPGKASQFTDDAACEAAVRQITEHASRMVVSSFLE